MDSGPPTDLNSGFIDPVPFQVICDILGIPEDARPDVKTLASRLTDLRFDPSDSEVAHQALIRFFGAIAESGASTQPLGILSQLLDDDASETKLTAEEAGGVGVMILNAGYESTSGVFAMGLLELFRHPAQLEFLMNRIHDDAVIDRATEEMLRYCSPLKHGIPRTSTTTTSIAGDLVRPGDLITVSITQANRDPDRFSDPTAFNIRKHHPRHLAFGHGIHLCPGNGLARLQLKIMLKNLLDRFPTLELTIPTSDVPFLQHALVHGCASFPVTW
jgi:cytochrome P450